MPDMGYRDNVMGPQPIGQRKPIPQSLHDAVAHILDLLADGKSNDLVAMAVNTAKDEVAKLASAAKAGIYSDKKVLATARTSEHYWIKAKLTGSNVKPFIAQFRLGPDGDRWLIWEATDLSNARSGWTR
jgi:hypothetical protein